MPKLFTSLALISAILLYACNSSSEKNAENAGKAMAETACLLFNETIELEEIEQMSEDIMREYGFSSSKEIDSYLASVRGTEELNKVSEAVRTHMESTCGQALAESDVSAADLAEAMVRE